MLEHITKKKTTPKNIFSFKINKTLNIYLNDSQ